jgi:hypothetical protein
MKAILTALIIITALNYAKAQCKIIYQKANGNLASNKESAKKIKPMIS